MRHDPDRSKVLVLAAMAEGATGLALVSTLTRRESVARSALARPFLDRGSRRRYRLGRPCCGLLAGASLARDVVLREYGCGVPVLRGNSRRLIGSAPLARSWYPCTHQPGVDMAL